MINKKFKETIKLICTRFRGKNIDWAIIGTTNLALQGIKIEPKDLDIVVNKYSLKMIENLFNNFIVQPIRKQKSVIKDIPDFYELKLKIKSVDVHISGEEKGSPFLKGMKNKKMIRLENINVPCLSLKAGMKVYSKMGRKSKVKLIKKFLQKHGNKSS
jgi:hypothetical protein